MVKLSTNKQSVSSRKQQQNNMLLAQNEFSSALCGEMMNAGSCHDNIIISPFSIYIALMNCMLGTSGETLKEMIDGLFLRDSYDSCKDGNSQKQFQKWKETELKQYSTMIKKIVQNEGLLSIANRIYVENSLELKREFVEELVDQFDSETQLVNFKKAQVKKDINEWVASKTGNTIKNLITDLDGETVMVIINAIYFNGKWKNQFNKNATVKKPFRSVQDPEGETSKCEMMSLEDCKTKFHFEEMDEYQILQMPYTDEEYCMTFIKPSDEVDIDEESESEFNSWLKTKLSDITQLYPQESVKMKRIQIPKFKFEKQFDNIIATMKSQPFNVSSVFCESKADFSNMLASAKDQGVYVNQIIHKACIQVDESGTVASAATAVHLKRKRRSNSEEDEVYEFIADRPFAFVLHHVPTQSVLFVGKINQTN